MLLLNSATLSPGRRPESVRISCTRSIRRPTSAYVSSSPSYMEKAILDAKRSVLLRTSPYRVLIVMSKSN